MSRIDQFLTLLFTVPFMVMGMVLYVVIGLPMAGLIAGWIVQRDICMKHKPKGK